MSSSSSPLWTIGLGTLSISATSAVVTGIYSITRNVSNPGLMVSAAAINSGATAAVFFSWREYAVSPLLVRLVPWNHYARRRHELGFDPLPSDEAITSQAATWSDLRSSRLLDSGVSGAFTGGVLRGLRTGRRAILPGALTVGAACTLLQYGFNELSVLRLRYITKLNEEKRSAVERPAVIPRGGNQTSDEHSSSAFQSVMKMIGFIPISEEEVLGKMKRSREVYQKRIAELEQQIEEDKVMKEMVRPKDISI